MAVLFILFGAAFTLASAYAFGAILARSQPPEIRLGIGAVVLSFAVFAVLLCGAASWWTFGFLGSAGLLAFAWIRPKLGHAQVWRPALLLAPFFVWYFVNALAPETVADGSTYHLGLPAEYLRHGGFPDHNTFYEILPQGMEMLYTMAFAFGKHSAAKLVEFGFFAATLPLIFRVGRVLGLPDLGSLVAAVLYFCAPVAGLTGSCSYNDAAGVFFLLAAIYSALTNAPLVAGVLAGFCYAIKMPGVMACGAGLLACYAPIRRGERLKTCATFLAGAALVIAPWMIRAALLTGNPIAPLGNALFPNPYFHIATETDLAASLRSLNGVTPAQISWQLAFGDKLAGTYGPLLLALPIGLLALRRREGRMLWLAAILLALPWLTNTGARFLMPSVMLAGFTLAMVLPRPLAWAAIAIQAIVCWPNVVALWEPQYLFRLHEFPIAAALRIEPEPDYLRRHVNEYNVAKMIERATPADARILALSSVATAYLDREADVFWQSAETDQLLDTLRLAGIYASTPTLDVKAAWPAQTVRALRFRPPAVAGEWDVSEIELFSDGYRIFNSPQWTTRGWPNRWEGPLAFDGNPATRWRTWQPVQSGMYYELQLGNPQRLTEIVMVTHVPTPPQVFGQDSQGNWRLLAGTASVKTRPAQDLRLDAARALRKAGFRYLLAPTGAGGNAPVGNIIVGHEAEWGLDQVGYAGDFHLFRVK